MADVIILSDDDFSPAVETHAGKSTSSSSNTNDKTVKQWNNIFSQKSIKRKNNASKPGHLSHYSSTHSSKQSSKGSSKDSSRHSSERHSRRQSSSHEDKGRHQRKRSSSVKDVIELVSDEDTSSSGMMSSKKTSLEKSSSGRSLEGSSNHHSSRRSSHVSQPGKSSKHHHSGSSQHHSNKSVLGKSENTSGKGSSAIDVPERPSSTKNSTEVSDSEEMEAVTHNGRRSGSRRSLAAKFGVSKAECRRDDDSDRSPRAGRHVANGDPSKQRDAEPAGEDRSSRSKRPASGGREGNSVVKRVCLTRVESKDGSDSASTADPKSEPKVDLEPCHQSLEEVCSLLKPLLSGPELKLEAKLRRRHAAVLAITGARAGRRQHLIGLTEQCAKRLREEPERCFTVLRWFLEQLDQIKIVASSAQSHTAPARVEAAPGGYEAGKTGTLARATKEGARTGAVHKKAAAADSSKASPLPSAAVGSAPPSTASSEQDEKEARRHRRHVAKLEKTLRRLEREIVRQDEQEVDWGDGAGSSYMVGARLKRRYVQVYRYYCQLVGAEEQAQRLDSRRIRFDGTRYPEINRRIDKFVNQTREFPDFKDVLSLIKTANRRDRLQLGPGALHDQAKEAFMLLGNLLQKRRRAAVAESMDALAGAEEWRGRDPAAGDPVLSGQLAENSASGKERLNEVFAEFVQRQETLAAERRQRHAGAAESSDEDEEDEAEDTEESEVTDEELEQEMPLSVGRDPPDSDASDQDTVLSDEEIGGPGEGVMNGARDQNGHESAKASDAKTEEGANAGRKVEVAICSAAGNSTIGPSDEGRAHNDNSQPDIKDDRESSADDRGTHTSIVDVPDTKRENEPRARKECEHADKSTEGEALGSDVSENNTLTARIEDK